MLLPTGEHLYPPHDLLTGVRAAQYRGGVTISLSYPVRRQ